MERSVTAVACTPSLGSLVEEAEHVFDLEINKSVGRRVFRKLDRLDLNRVIAVVVLVSGERDHLRVPMIDLPPLFRLVDVGRVDAGAARTIVMDDTNLGPIDANHHIEIRMCEVPHVKNQETRMIGFPAAGVEGLLPHWITIPNVNRAVSHNKGEITEHWHF